MADIAFVSMGKIIDVAHKIKEAVEMVKHNKKECCDIQRCVARVSALLKRLDEATETMKDDVMQDTLADLAVSLDRALELVTECQQKHIFRRFLGARDMAKELDRVQNDIVRKLQLGNFATNVQTTVVLTNIQSAGRAHPRQTLPPAQRVIVEGFIQFSFSELKTATKDFSDKNVIGKGGFATVYKGILLDGQVVAIKELSSPIFLRDNENRLYDTINIFIELKHKNIIRPLGFCHEVKMFLVSYNGRYAKAREQRFCLIEEYMPKGSMDKIINEIDWSSRFKIIEGIAEGLRYLHEQRVVHLDVKPANILLDSFMNPRICDFGVARRLEHGDDEIIQDNDSIAGTLGYMAPEYISDGILSTKCDVYAFGLTLLGTINGMLMSVKPSIPRFIWAWEEAQDDAARMALFNPSLCDKSQLTQIKRCTDVGLMCIEDDRNDRPAMADVLAILNGEKDVPALSKNN